MTTVSQTAVKLPFEATTITFKSATSTTSDAAERFEITPDCSDDRYVIIVKNGSADKSVTVYIEGGDYVSGSDTKTCTLASGTESVIAIDSAMIKKSSGKIVLVATPPAGSALDSCSFSVGSVSMRQIATL